MRGTVLVQGPWHCLQEEVASLGLQVEQITFPQDVTTNCEEVMFMHILQWIQECMMVAQKF